MTAEIENGCVFSYSPWSKRLFADTASVHTGNARLIFASGKSSEQPESGEIQYPGDCAAQTLYAYEHLQRMLQNHGADLEHIVRLTVYLTDMNKRTEYEHCQQKVFAHIPHMPTHTLIGVTTLAHPGMVVEVEATAVLPL